MTADPRIEAACAAYDSFALTGDGDPHRHAMKLALAAADAVVVWQPIETAPKDGAWFIAIDYEDGGLADGDIFRAEGPRWFCLGSSNYRDRMSGYTHARLLDLPEPPR